jgi:replicative DNA helicase
MNALALQAANSPVTVREMPASLDLEHAIIGIVLYDNDALSMIEGLAPDHFHEATHGRIWMAMSDMAAKGRRAELFLVAEKLASDPGFIELGGPTFLADLVDKAPPSRNAPDYGKALIALAQRRDLIRLAENVIDAARADDDAQSVIGMAEAGLLAMQVRSRPLELVSAGSASARILEQLDAPPEVLFGTSTGLLSLDEVLGPMLPGNLILLMGRPSMGKSAAAECIGLNIAKTGLGVIEINGEMSAEEMTQRHLTDLCFSEFQARGPEYRDIRRRRITADQRRMLGWAHEQLSPLPIRMIKRPGLKLSQLRSLARRQVAAWARQDIKLGALIVDHVGLIHPDTPTRDRYADQTIVSNAMKELADELDCPLIGLNQMNRQNENREDKRPQLSDLRDSGSWEQDADFVIGWYREAYYAQRQAEPSKDVEWAEWDRARKSRVIEAIILKARAGETTTVKLWGDVARNAIRSEAPEYGDLM